MTPTETREPVRMALLALAGAIAERAEKLATRVEGKLEPVCTVGETVPKLASADIEPPWPPLFDELRTLIGNTSAALDRIENTISKVEL